MSLSRRQLLSGIAGVTGALLLPPTLVENVEAAGRRYWALDSAMLGYGPWEYQTIGAGVVGVDHHDIAKIRQRSVPGGHESEVVWFNADYHGSLAVVSEANGAITIEFKGVLS